MEAYKQLIFVNILGVAIAASIFKSFLISTKQREFYAKKDLENANKKIIDIAMESGFETLRTFNRDFIKKMNISPSEYRLKVIKKSYR